MSQKVRQLFPVTPPAGGQPDSSLEGRYSSAWNEQAVRIAQRQAVMTLYLAGVSAMFAALLVHRDMGVPLQFGVTVFNWVCSAMITAHHDVMKQLQEFMRKIEKILATTRPVFVFYFANPANDQLAPFHKQQRRQQKKIFCGAALASALGAAIFAWRGHPASTAALQLAMFAASAIAAFYPFHDNIKAQMQRPRRPPDTTIETLE